MPRQRDPLSKAQAKGAVDKNPGRYVERNKSPKYGGEIGPAPFHFTADQVQLWEALVNTIPAGVLAAADRYIVEIAVVLMVKFRDSVRPYDPDSELPPPRPMTATELGHLRAALGSLGMTPADRTRVNGPDGAEETDPLGPLLSVLN